MAPKSRSSAGTPSAAASSSSGNAAAASPAKTSTPSAKSSAPSTARTAASSSSSSSSSSATSAQDILAQLWNAYVDRTPQRTKLVDVFLLFLMVVGGLQFLYCILMGNYPYNAFLAGFGITVGQFVLTASLRIQTNAENAAEFKSVSPERAFADYVLGSLILHFFCVNFIN